MKLVPHATHCCKELHSASTVGSHTHICFLLIRHGFTIWGLPGIGIFFSLALTLGLHPNWPRPRQRQVPPILSASIARQRRSSGGSHRSQPQQGTMDMSQLRVMSIVGPMGIGKTTLAVDLCNRIRHHETSGGHYYFQCNVMAQASGGADRNILLLQDILSQVSEPAAATALSSDPSSEAKTMEVLFRLVSECMRDKRYQ